jgi:hypothetical protein
MILTVQTYEVMEPGEYIAKVGKIETVQGEYGERLKIGFELVEHPGSVALGWCNPKLGPKTTLYQWTKAICFGGEDFTGDFDVNNLVGRVCRLVLTVEAGKDGQDRNKIVEVFPPRRRNGSTPAPAADDRSIPKPRPPLTVPAGGVPVNTPALPGPDDAPAVAGDYEEWPF